MKSRIVKLSSSRQFNEKSVPYMILAELVKITAAGEKTIKVDEVPSYKMAFEMLQDYILEDPDMDDYVVEKYEDYMTGRDIHGKEKEIRLLEKNGEIGERSVSGFYEIVLRVAEQANPNERQDDYFLDDDYYAESRKRRLAQEGIGKLIGTAAKGLWRAMKPALKEVAKDVAKDIAKDAAKAGIKMAMTGIGKLNNALISKIRGVSPATADVIESAGMIFLQSCSENNVTEESLTQYANQFIEKAIDGADKKDMEVLGEMRKELENTKDSEEKIAKVGNMVAVAKQTSTEEKQEMKQAAESRKRR